MGLTLALFSSCEDGLFAGSSDKYTLLINIEPPERGNIIKSPDKSKYSENEEVTLTAIASNNFIFSHWAGDAQSIDNIIKIKMNADKALTANFLQTYVLTTNIEPADGGTVIRSQDAARYPAGTGIVLTAVPAEGYIFKKWSGSYLNPGQTDNDTIKINTNSFAWTLTAEFEYIADNEKLSVYINKVNKTFEVGGKRLWINGVNTPWDKWNDFGGGYNPDWWDTEFARLNENGINAARVWINCDGNGSVLIDNLGYVTGASAKHWNDLDSFFSLAKKHKVYIMATLTSFDHYRSGNPKSGAWRAMINSRENCESFANNYTKTFVNRYKSNPYLWCFDLCNEPEWASDGDGGLLRWTGLQYFFAVNTAVIHKNSDKLVTVGIGYAKWNVEGNGCNGNMVSDTRLMAQYPYTEACLDFFSPHYYSWVGQYYGVIMYLTPNGNRSGNASNGYYGGYGLDGTKPALIGECSAMGTGPDRSRIRTAERPPNENTIITDYEYAYLNGWQGIMPWTSNGVDANGGLHNTRLGEATKYMEAKYPDLIYPWGK